MVRSWNDVEARMPDTKRADPRTNTRTAAWVDDALRILRSDGVHPAFVFMQLAGVPRHVAMRLLCSPDRHRRADRRSRLRPGA